MLDDKVTELIASIKKQKSEIERIKNPCWQTNCSIGNQYLDIYNLHVEKDMIVLDVII